MDFNESDLPQSLQFAFQEYNLEKLSLQNDAFTIIERTLAYGNRQELRWLFACYGSEQVLKLLQQGAWRTLPRRRLIFWTVYFDLPPFPEKRGVWTH